MEGVAQTATAHEDVVAAAKDRADVATLDDLG
jgi:hypothetical protein